MADCEDKVLSVVIVNVANYSQSVVAMCFCYFKLVIV